MKVYYKRCVKCKELKPLISYFLSKEENLDLTNKEKSMCYDCYEKNKSRNKQEIGEIEKQIKNEK